MTTEESGRPELRVPLKAGERIDDLHRNGYQIIQQEKGFCFGMDAVLLSGFAVVKPGERALDLGTGTGIIPLLLSAKTDGKHFTGLEIQTEIADMAAVYHDWVTRHKSKATIVRENGISRPTLDRLLKEYEREVVAKSNS